MSRALRTTLLHRSWVAWLAVLLAVFAALAPTVSHALVAARGDASPWLEICTSTGPRSVSLGTPASSPGEDDSSSQHQACAFCLLQAERAAPPFTAQVHHFASAGELGLPVFWQTVAVPAPFVLAAQPRGPPTLITPFFAA